MTTRSPSGAERFQLESWAEVGGDRDELPADVVSPLSPSQLFSCLLLVLADLLWVKNAGGMQTQEIWAPVRTGRMLRAAQGAAW